MRTRTPLRLAPCERATIGTRPTLFLRDAPEPSVLVLKSNGNEIEVIVHPRYARLLLLLMDAWHEDAGEREAHRGFRSRTEIALGFRRFLDSHGPVDPETVVHYVYHLRQLVESALAATGGSRKGQAVDLLEHRRNQGYRIGPLGMEVIRLPRRDPSAD